MKTKFLNIIKCFCLLGLIIISTTRIRDFKGTIYNDNINKTINLSTMALKLEETIQNDIYSAKDTFTGDLTGYIYNCPLCSGRLACKYDLDLSDGKTFFNDYQYGNVRIVASSSNLSCGTIVRFNSPKVSDQPVLAIVLDRGVHGNSLDLLTESLDAARVVGRSSITYEVLREGYGS